jgi:hypothetical protein
MQNNDSYEEDLGIFGTIKYTKLDVSNEDTSEIDGVWENTEPKDVIFAFGNFDDHNYFMIAPKKHFETNQSPTDDDPNEDWSDYLDDNYERVMECTFVYSVPTEQVKADLESQGFVFSQKMQDMINQDMDLDK